MDADPMSTSQPAPSPKVLVVEDNKTNLLLARRILEKSGCRVEVAMNGREGVEAARHKVFDVIFMDVQMPVLNGCDAAREIRRFPGWASRVPIVALSASVLIEDTRQCFEAGMDDFVSKPFKIAELIEKCQLWIGRRPAASHYCESF
jgi:CheY-like chemotaxis protein